MLQNAHYMGQRQFLKSFKFKKNRTHTFIGETLDNLIFKETTAGIF